MWTVRLLHLSDLHIAKEPRIVNFKDTIDLPLYYLRKYGRVATNPFHSSSYEPEAALFLSKVYETYRDMSDLTIVTGDLATTGRRTDLEAALEYFSGRPRRSLYPSQNIPSLGGTPSYLKLMPGNHDRYSNRRGRSGGRLFDMLFNNFWQPQNDVDEIVFKSRNKVDEIESQESGNNRFGIICADFCLNTDADAGAPGVRTLARYGRGIADKSRLDELVKRTQAVRDELRADNVVLIWAIHWPPNHPDSGSFMRLKHEQSVIEKAQELEIPIILSGHLHSPSKVPLDNVLVICAGTPTAMDARNAAHVLDFEIDGQKIKSVFRRNYVLSRTRGRFVLDGPKKKIYPA